MAEYSNIIEALQDLIKCKENKLRFLRKKIPDNFLDVKVKVMRVTEDDIVWSDLGKSCGRSEIDHSNNEIFPSRTLPCIIYLCYSSSKWCTISAVEEFDHLIDAQAARITNWR